MEEDKKDDEEISIDLSKITNFFKRKKKEEVEEIKEEVKETEKEVERRIVEEKEKLKGLQKDEKIISEIKKEVRSEEKEAKNIDKIPGEDGLKAFKKEEDKFQKDFAETKEKISEVREDLENDDEEISINFSKIKNFRFFAYSCFPFSKIY